MNKLIASIFIAFALLTTTAAAEEHEPLQIWALNSAYDAIQNGTDEELARLYGPNVAKFRATMAQRASGFSCKGGKADMEEKTLYTFILTCMNAKDQPLVSFRISTEIVERKPANFTEVGYYEREYLSDKEMEFYNWMDLPEYGEVLFLVNIELETGV